MINNIGFRIWLMWADNILSHLRRKRLSPRKFAIITPPFLAEQKIKHVDSNKTFIVKIRNSVDLRTLYDIFYKEDYSAHQFIDRMSAVNSNYVIIDLGANIGCASLYFLYVFQGAQVIALEPNCENFSMLSSNLVNFNTSAILLNVGAGPRDAFCGSINSDKITGQYDSFKFEESESGEIKMRSMQGLIDEFASQNRRVLLKIDIEGYERQLFEGDTSWFEKVDAVFIEGHDWMMPRASSLSGFLSLINNKNFDVFVKGENIIAVRHSCYE